LPWFDHGQSFEFVGVLKGHHKDQKRATIINSSYDWLGFDIDFPDFLRTIDVAH
jgi:hypothetical protein